ncbi:MAG: gamma-glutamyl-gamma-aminobutyrate hydrolase family protein [Clostridiales bacterium]|nr:gamma-glutamyl-gamma-aminobutyrate hydrolase family protein [Clostridiales bacterium]
MTPAFSENRYTLNSAYTSCITNEGGIPLIIPYQEFTDAAQKIISGLDGVILSGGGDIHASFFRQKLHPQANAVYPERDKFEIKLCRFCIAHRIPLFCICRGLQVLNVALGGDIIQHIDGHSQKEPREFPSHLVSVYAGALRDIYKSGEIYVNSLHHQAAGKIGEGLEICAVSKDGVTEALEYTKGTLAIGVQWHPEVLRGGRALFEFFIKKAVGG